MMYGKKTDSNFINDGKIDKIDKKKRSKKKNLFLFKIISPKLKQKYFPHLVSVLQQ